ncbi:MAG: hypothetical protein ACOZAO_05670 [Patescibacteria group bacterium]
MQVRLLSWPFSEEKGKKVLVTVSGKWVINAKGKRTNIRHSRYKSRYGSNPLAGQRIPVFPDAGDPYEFCQKHNLSLQT